MFEGYDLFGFIETFTCEDKCREYLYNMKWGSGYKCSRCGCTKSWKGRTQYHRRCSACWYDESVTANNVFHKIKIPLLKAFWMAFQISVPKKASSTLGLAREYKVSKDSAWLFKRKCQEAVRTSVSEEEPRYHYLKEMILKERINKKKARFFPDTMSQIHKADLKPVYKIETLSSFPDLSRGKRMISFTLVGVFPKGNIVARNFKTWIDGVHHHCSDRFVNGYLAEYFFRYHHRNNMEGIWHRLIECFMRGKPYLYKGIES